MTNPRKRQLCLVKTWGSVRKSDNSEHFSLFTELPYQAPCFFMHTAKMLSKLSSCQDLPGVLKMFMLNSTEHENATAYKIKVLKMKTFLAFKLLDFVFTMLINVRMPTIVKVFRIIPEFRILRLTCLRKSASKC